MLAAIDSSVGGKTAVDLPEGKNLVGAFHQPRLVLCDPDTLATLPRETFADGVAEAVKYGVLQDRALFERLAGGDFGNDLDGIIARCVAIKADFVARDEFDRGARKFLNLGHTFGHAVEAASNFAVSHGSAVAIGMVAAARAAEKMGIAREPVAGPLAAALEANFGNGLSRIPGHSWRQITSTPGTSIARRLRRRLPCPRFSASSGVSSLLRWPPDIIPCARHQSRSGARKRST